MSEQRNIIIAIALSIAIFVIWSKIFPPAPPPQRSDQPADTSSTATAVPGLPGVTQAAPGPVTLEEALAQSARVPIDAPRVEGSINLTGARIDYLRLKDYREKLDKESPMIVLLSPNGTPGAYYTEFGWGAPQGSRVPLPQPTTVWQLESGTRLAPGTPVTLRWDNGAGLIFRITYAVDDNFMITATQDVQNVSGSDVALLPYGAITRFQPPEKSTAWFLHEGFTGWLGDSLKNRGWKKLRKEGGGPPINTTGGWLGFADKYWLVALAPPQQESFTATTGVDKPEGLERFVGIFQLDSKVIPSGGKRITESHFFAGAKEVKTIDAYERSLALKRFDLAIDWGWFRFLTKPVFFLLEFFKDFTGSFGLAILMVTVCVKILFFPLANRSYETMGKMKKLQPQLKEIQERYKDDKVELQKNMMALYQKEKVNPLAGCLPVFLQIPVWYSLYNVLFMTIEMRHAPFFGWIQDLSAKDPTTIVNLFGLLPFGMPAWIPLFLMVGAWPIIMGVTMLVQTSLNPAPTDPSQKIIFTWMPIVFTFMLAPMPAGLVIYWTWNNILSILQQITIMHRMGTPPDYSNMPLVKPITRLLKGTKPDKEKPAVTTVIER